MPEASTIRRRHLPATRAAMAIAGALAYPSIVELGPAARFWS
ncbi:hypothetical protein [Propionicicella superfundia]|nr:hypothetical protein [Propionicicella superfundia]